MAGPAGYPDFSAVRRLGDQELRRVLHAGEPVERAWAGWALALRMGASANPDLIAALNETPTPGVRTLLLVILAGHGERGLIETFAKDDPDDDVRAAASRNLAMIAGPDDMAARAFLDELLLADPSPTVRAEVLRLAIDRRVQVSRLHVAFLAASDPDIAVRTLGVDLLLDPELGAGGFEQALESRALYEPDDELRARIARAWIDAGGTHLLLADLRTEGQVAGDALVAEHLALLVRTGQSLEWEALQPFIDRDPSIDALVAQLVSEPVGTDALSWLLRLDVVGVRGYQAGLDPVARRRGEAVRRAGKAADDRLTTILPTVDRTALGQEDLDHLRELARALEEYLVMEREIELEDEGVDLDALPDDELPTFYREGKQLLPVYRRLLGTGGPTPGG